MLLSLAETLSAACRKDEALKGYRSIQADESAMKSHREAAGKAIKTMESGRMRKQESRPLLHSKMV
jgi:hypothetical protein